MKVFLKESWLLIVIFLAAMIVIVKECMTAGEKRREAGELLAIYVSQRPVDTLWHGVSKSRIPRGTEDGELIWYGEQLIENTSHYLGPKGKVMQITNSMNCQNCHLSAGTIPYGNNFGKVYATYPQFRARNNGIQSIYDRVNDCLERSLNGQKLDTTTLEMRAIYAYIKWLGDGIPKGVARGGTSLVKLAYLDRAADPAAGKRVYVNNCQSCHGGDGKGQLNIAGTGYAYPPLWGDRSYNDGAGLFRLGTFASFVMYNMPFGTDHHAPKLTNEEAWDVAAYVNSQPRPHKDQQADWQDPEKKPVDFPFGPYADIFTEKQHKYGPFEPIIAAHKIKTP